MLNNVQVLEVLNQDKAPELKDRWTDVYYSMSLHTCGARPAFTQDGVTITPPNYFGREYQLLFDRFLLNSHPRESAITRNWRYSQYRPYTKAAFLQVIEIISSAIFQDSNYSITLPSDPDTKYIWGENFEGVDLMQYFEKKVIRICEDPNGWFMVLPKQAYYQTTTAYVEPEIYFVPSCDIKFISSDEIVYTRGENTAWVVNRYSIYRYSKNAQGKWSLMDADYGGYYAHGMGMIPGQIAGGIDNTKGFLESWLTKAVPAADDFIPSKSNEQLIDKESSHPWITVADEKCKEPDCHNGYIQFEDDEEPGGYRLEKCKACGGTGRSSQNPGERLHAPAEMMQYDLVKVTNPEIDINKYHFEKNKEVFLMILDALNLTKAQESQSGIAKAIDQERLYLFIQKMSNDIIGRVVFNCLKYIIGYRNVTTRNGATVPAVYRFTFIKPTQFQIKTGADLLADLKAGTEANIPAYVRKPLIVDYVDKQFGGDPLLKKTAEVIHAIDYLAVYNIDEKLTLATLGTDQRDIQFSNRLASLLDEVIREKSEGWFMSADITAISDAVHALFDKLVPPVTKPIPNAGI
jgi:hypothetical protein